LPVFANLNKEARDDIDFFVVGKTNKGNHKIIEEFKPSFTIKDDSDLELSFKTEIETMPFVLFVDQKIQSKKTELASFARE
jgi:hypothetical protein